MGVIEYAGVLHSSDIATLNKINKVYPNSIVKVSYNLSNEVVSITHNKTKLEYHFKAALVRDTANQFVAVSRDAEAVYIIKE